MRRMSGRAFALAAAAAILVTACSTTGTPSGGGGTGADQGKPFVFASTQFSPVTEQENMRKKILAAYLGASVDFVTDQEPVILNRISAEVKAGGDQQIGLAGLENGQFAALVAAGAFDDITKIADKHKDQKIPQDMLTLGKFGGSAQVYIPWMQATYFMVASKQALQYLVLVHETLGPDWMTPERFRIGASSLLNDVLMQISKERTGRYQGPDYFTID